MRLHVVKIAAGALVLALFLPACSKKKPGEVTVTFLDGPDIGRAWKAVIERFEEEHPGIRVELVEGPTATDARENMYSTSFLSGSSGSAYDLVYMDIIWTPKFAQAGWLEPLDGRFGPDMWDEFLPGDMQGSWYEGKVYRIPVRSDAGMLYYRKDILEEAGVAPPQTFDELLDIALRLQKPPELWGFVFQGKQYEGLICAFLEVLWGAGGEVIDERGAVVIDSQEAVAALRWLRDAVNVHGISPPGVTTYEEEEARHVFQEGRAIFMRNWPYAWTLAQKEDSPIRGKVGIVPMVHAEGGKSAATLGGWGFGLSRFSEHKDEAWAFAEFAASEEGQKIMHLKNGMIPTRHSLFEDEEILAESPYYKDFYKVLITARPRPVHPKYSQISDVLQVHVSAALVGDKEPEAALRDAAEEMKTVLERNPE